jgi:hypothetical protein
MSNQQKDKDISDHVGIQFFLSCHCEFWSKRRFFSGCSVCPEQFFSGTVDFQNSYLLNCWLDGAV